MSRIARRPDSSGGEVCTPGKGGASLTRGKLEVVMAEVETDLKALRRATAALAP